MWSWLKSLFKPEPVVQKVELPKYELSDADREIMNSMFIQQRVDTKIEKSSSKVKLPDKKVESKPATKTDTTSDYNYLVASSYLYSSDSSSSSSCSSSSSSSSSSGSYD